MKAWTRLLACMLIAWLPMLGYPVQAAFCAGKTSPMPMTSHHHPQRAGDVEAGRHTVAPEHPGRDAQQPACYSEMGGFVCGMAAIPVSHAVQAISSKPVYRAIARALAPQFIPAPPVPPPRFL